MNTRPVPSLPDALKRLHAELPPEAAVSLYLEGADGAAFLVTPLPQRDMLPAAGDPPTLVDDQDEIANLLPGTNADRALVLPIADGDRLVGLLSVAQSPGEPDRTQQWIDHARDVGAGMRVLQSAKRDLQLDLISRLGRRDIWEMDLPAFFDLTVVSIRETLEYYNVSLFTLQEGDRHLVLAAHAGAYRDRVSRGDRQSVEEGMLGWAVRNQRTLLANDVNREPHYMAVEGLATRAEICIPFFVDGRVEGVLNVESDQLWVFDEGDVTALEALAQQIGDMIRMRRQHQAFTHLKAEVEETRSSRRILGRSTGIQQVLDRVRSVADSDMSVLVCGETGTGKELVARSLHDQSPRAGAPFVAVNCAALPEHLFESEIFGHEKGAFTGAERKRIGKMELAHGGTLFLDEIGEIAPSMQAKLLRAIEEKRFTRIGGEREIAVDVRIVSATNRPLAELQGQEQFRRDLFFRINAVDVQLPPLRERREDIPLLAAHFMRQACDKLGKSLTSIAPEALKSLMNHDWPGNIRELENTVARAVLLTEGESLAHVEITTGQQQQTRPLLPDGSEELQLAQVRGAALAEIEREYMRRVLTRTRGNISRAARMAGVNRRTFYNKLHAYDMQRDDFIASS